jgi:predicted Zn-ribbon and HTH transcriptional regulator
MSDEWLKDSYSEMNRLENAEPLIKTKNCIDCGDEHELSELNNECRCVQCNQDFLEETKM